jgi:hypothetical protein
MSNRTLFNRVLLILSLAGLLLSLGLSSCDVPVTPPPPTATIPVPGTATPSPEPTPSALPTVEAPTATPEATMTPEPVTPTPGATVLAPGLYTGPLRFDTDDQIVSAYGAIVEGGVIIGGDRVTVLGLEVRNAPGRGIDVQGAGAILRDVYVHDSYSHGIHVAARGVLVEGARIERAVLENASGNMASGFGSALKCALGGQDVVFRGNTIIDSNGEGIAVTRCYDVLIEGNTIIDSRVPNLYIDNSYNVTAQDNVVQCVARFSQGLYLGEERYSGAWGAQLHDVEFNGNRVEGCSNGVAYYGSDVGADVLHNILIANNEFLLTTRTAIYLDGQADNVSIVGNLIVQAAGQYKSVPPGTLYTGNTERRDLLPAPTPTPEPTATPLPPLVAQGCQAAFGGVLCEIRGGPYEYSPSAVRPLRAAPSGAALGYVYPDTTYWATGLVHLNLPDGSYQEWLQIPGGYTAYFHPACGGWCGRLTIPDAVGSVMGYQSEVSRPFFVEDDNARFGLPYMAWGAEDYLRRYAVQRPDALIGLRIFDANCGSNYNECRSQQGWIAPAEGVAQLVEGNRWRWQGFERPVYVQFDNETQAEPGAEARFWRDFDAWQVEMLRQINAEGHAALLGNFSVGTPRLADWQYMTGMLQACADAGPERCAINLHEYGGACYWATGYPYLVGRYQHALAEWAQLGVEPLPAVVIGEAGFDFVAGGTPWSLCGDAGLVPAGISPGAWYADNLIAMDALWRRSPQVQAGFVFLAGYANPVWAGFQVEGEPADVLRAYWEVLYAD